MACRNLSAWEGRREGGPPLRPLTPPRLLIHELQHVLRRHQTGSPAELHPCLLHAQNGGWGWGYLIPGHALLCMRVRLCVSCIRFPANRSGIPTASRWPSALPRVVHKTKKGDRCRERERLRLSLHPVWFGINFPNVASRLLSAFHLLFLGLERPFTQSIAFFGGRVKTEGQI